MSHGGLINAPELEDEFDSMGWHDDRLHSPGEGGQGHSKFEALGQSDNDRSMSGSGSHLVAYHPEVDGRHHLARESA